MKNSKNDKIQLITHKTLIIGVDIAKRVQWAQFTDYRGLEVSKHLKFNNDLTGFKSIIQNRDYNKKLSYTEFCICTRSRRFFSRISYTYSQE